MRGARPVGAAGPAPGWHVLRMLHPFPSLLVTVVTVAIAVFADPGGSRVTWAQLGGGMLLFQFSIGIMNDVVDATDDRASKPWKPIARGAFRRDRAALLAGMCAGAGLLVTITFPLQAWLVGVVGLGCGLAYDVVLKRTVLSWLPYAIAIPLVPIWVYAAIDAWDALLWWTLPLGALLGFSLHIANQLPDADQDGRRGIRSAAQRVDTRRAYGLAVGAFGVAASVAVIVLVFESPGRAGLAALDAFVVALLGPRATRFFGRDGLFGVLAAATATLSVVFLSAV